MTFRSIAALALVSLALPEAQAASGADGQRWVVEHEVVLDAPAGQGTSLGSSLLSGVIPEETDVSSDALLSGTDDVTVALRLEPAPGPGVWDGAATGIDDGAPDGAYRGAAAAARGPLATAKASSQGVKAAGLVEAGYYHFYQACDGVTDFCDARAKPGAPPSVGHYQCGDNPGSGPGGRVPDCIGEALEDLGVENGGNLLNVGPLLAGVLETLHPTLTSIAELADGAVAQGLGAADLPDERPGPKAPGKTGLLSPAKAAVPGTGAAELVVAIPDAPISISGAIHQDVGVTITATDATGSGADGSVDASGGVRLEPPPASARHASAAGRLSSVGPAHAHPPERVSTGSGAWISTRDGADRAEVPPASASAAITVVLAGLAILAALAPLLHRLRSHSTLLDHASRKRLYGFLLETGGATAGDAARALGVSRTTARYHAALMMAHGLVREQAVGNRVLLLANGGERSPEDVTAAAVLRREPARKLLSAVAARPDIPLRDLARRAGLSLSGAYWYVNRLEAMGLITTRREARRIVYAVAPAAAITLAEFVARPADGAGESGASREDAPRSS